MTPYQKPGLNDDVHSDKDIGALPVGDLNHPDEKRAPLWKSHFQVIKTRLLVRVACRFQHATADGGKVQALRECSFDGAARGACIHESFIGSAMDFDGNDRLPSAALMFFDVGCEGKHAGGSGEAVSDADDFVRYFLGGEGFISEEFLSSEDGGVQVFGVDDFDDFAVVHEGVLVSVPLCQESLEVLLAEDCEVGAHFPELGFSLDGIGFRKEFRGYLAASCGGRSFAAEFSDFQRGDRRRHAVKASREPAEADSGTVGGGAEEAHSATIAYPRGRCECPGEQRHRREF